MLRPRLSAPWAAILLAALPAGAAPAQESARGPLDEAEFVALHRALQPDRDFAWERIPWRLDLLAAREEARREGMPLFIWSLNGHPLGCS